MWVHVSIMHCSFELSQVTLPFVLLRPPPVGRPRKRPRRDGEKGERDRKEGRKEKKKKKKKKEKGDGRRRNERPLSFRGISTDDRGKEGTKALKEGAAEKSVVGWQEGERHIHCPPQPNPHSLRK